MWLLQQASRIEEFEPPMGTAQEGSVVGGVGIWVKGWQDIVVGYWDGEESSVCHVFGSIGEYDATCVVSGWIGSKGRWCSFDTAVAM